MKTITKTHKLSRRHQITTLALNIGLFAGLSALPLHAQDEEWYDPGNWSIGNNSETVGTDLRDSDGWSNSTNYENSTGHTAYGEGVITGTNNQTSRNQQAGRNQQQYQGDQQAGRNQQRYQSDQQAGRNQQRYQSDQQAGRNQQRYQSDQQAGRNQQQYQSDQQAGRNQQQNQTNQQAGRNQQQDWSDRNQQAHRDQDQSMKTVSFNGKVDGFKRVNIKDSEGKLDEQTFVRIRLSDDDARVVSLGSRLIVSDLDLENGDQISVTGRKARIENQDVLVASRIEVDDKLFLVRKHNRPDTDQQSSIQGTVKDVTKTSLGNGSREQNLLIRLELNNGKSCVVDLGQGTTLSELDIEKGSEIRVQGEKTKVDGKSLIVANMITVDGDRTRVGDRSQGNQSTRSDRTSDSRYDSQGSVSRD